MRRYLVGLLFALLITGPVGSNATHASPVIQPPRPWLVNADGSGQRQLSERYSFEEPSWSPNGDRFAVGTFDGALVLNVGGGEMQVPWGLQPDWSPVRSDLLVVLASGKGSEPGIYTVDLDTNEMVPVVTHLSETNPVWSPDGTRIAFVAGSGSGSPGRLHVVDADGTDLRQVSATDALYVHPAWSPDSTRIAFTSWDYGLYVVDADGTDERRLDPDSGDDGFSPTNPDWSPDGTKIATDGLDVWNLDGSSVQRLANGGSDPDWSPAGTEIAYSVGSPPRIRVVTADGSASRDVSHVEDGGYHSDRDPAWSPDGSMIAFGRSTTSGWPPPGFVWIKYERKIDPDSFRGSIDGVTDCQRDREVRVKKVRSGRDRVIGKDMSNDSGSWRVPAPGAQGRFYAVVAPKPIDGGTCPRMRTPTIKV